MLKFFEHFKLGLVGIPHPSIARHRRGVLPKGEGVIPILTYIYS